MAKKTLQELFNPWSALREIGIDISPEEQARGIAGSVNDIAGIFGYDPELTPEGVQKFRDEAPRRPLADVVRDVANGAIGEVREHPFATVANVAMGAPKTAMGVLRATPKVLRGGNAAASPMIRLLMNHPQGAAIAGALGYRMLPDGEEAPAQSPQGGGGSSWQSDLKNQFEAIESITEPIEQMVGANGMMSERARLTDEHLTKGAYTKSAPGTASRANDAYSKVLQQSYLAENPELQAKMMEIMARRGGDSKTRLALEKEFRSSFDKMLPLLKTDRGLQEEWGLSDKNPGDLARGLQKKLEERLGIQMPEFSPEPEADPKKASVNAASEGGSIGWKELGGSALGMGALIYAARKNPGALKKLFSAGGKAAPAADAKAAQTLTEMIAASKGKGTKMAGDVFGGYKGAAPRAYTGKAVDKATVLKRGRDAGYDRIFDKALAAEEKTKATIQAQMDRISDMMGKKLPVAGVAKDSKRAYFPPGSSAASVSEGAKPAKQMMKEAYALRKAKKIKEAKELEYQARKVLAEEAAIARREPIKKRGSDAMMYKRLKEIFGEGD